MDSFSSFVMELNGAVLISSSFERKKKKKVNGTMIVCGNGIIAGVFVDNIVSI